MQREAFWRTRDRNTYTDILESCTDSINSMQEKDAAASISTLGSCQAQMKPLKEEFDHFCCKAAESSATGTGTSCKTALDY